MNISKRAVRHFAKLLPPHFAGESAIGVIAGEPIAQFEIGNYKNFVYLILDWATKKAAIVDPQLDLSLPRESLEKHGFQLSEILLTHTHGDHTAGVPSLIRDFPEVPIRVHADDLHRLSGSGFHRARIQTIQEGDKVPVGHLSVQVLHTPGHSAGECCFFLSQTSVPYLFTGDTVFIHDCGRTDLETGSNEEMFHSLQRIKQLPPETIILPGHHYRSECASTVGWESTQSPPFQCKTQGELAALP